jgi:hypothetical protein
MDKHFRERAPTSKLAREEISLSLTEFIAHRRLARADDQRQGKGCYYARHVASARGSPPGGFNCKAGIVDQRQAHVEAEVIYPPVMPDAFWTYKQGPPARNQDPFIIFLKVVVKLYPGCLR